MAGAELRRAPKKESLLGNRLTVLLSGAAAGFGEGFALAVVVVAAYIALHTDNLVTVGFAPALGFGLWNIGGLIAGMAIAGRARRLPWSFAANLVRTGMMGLIAYIAYQDDVIASDRIQAFLICYAVFAYFSGFASVATNTMVRASLDVASRTRVLHLRAIVAALLAALAGVIAHEVFSDTTLSTDRAFGFIFIGAAAAMAASTFFAFTIRETPGPVPRPPVSPGGGSAHNRGVRAVRRYVSIRVLLAAAGMADAFLIVYGIRELDMGPEFIGISVVAFAIATAAGLLFWSAFERSRVPRTSLQFASFLKVIPPLIAISIPYLESSAYYDDHTSGNALLHWMIVGAFVALGLAMASIITSSIGFLATVPPGLASPSATISNGALALTSMSGFLAGWIADRWGLDRLFAVALAVAIIALLSTGSLPVTAINRARPGPATTRAPGAMRTNRLSIR
ncbi:hypothetical protein BH23CHL4_BH23CHL4_19790 [soil metagenome]